MTAWPVFERTGVALCASSAPSPSIYWPCVVPARRILGPDALDEFYLYWSTDHAGVHSTSGVWVATGPTQAGPWTPLGRVYRDDHSGSQTETPTVFADPTGQAALVMLYQQTAAAGATGQQSTCWATSDDGLNWTRGGVAIDVTTQTVGDGHTGYARVHQVGSVVYSHHLRGGTSWPHFALSVSSDGGRTFHQVTSLGYARDQVQAGRRIEWNSGDVVTWRGASWWVGVLANFSSGSTPKDARLAVAPITGNLTHLIGTPRHILRPLEGTETDDYRSCHTVTASDGALILTYQCGSTFYTARAEP